MKPAYRVIAILQIALISILVLLTALIFYPLQNELSSRVNDLKNQLISLLEEGIGNDVQYSSIHPSIFSYIEIRNLRILTDGDDSLLTIDRLIFRYDIREVLQGNVLAAPKMVEIRGGRLALVTGATGSDLQNQDSSTADPREGAEVLIGNLLSRLSSRLTLNLRNMVIELHTADGLISSISRISRGTLALNEDQIDAEISLSSQLQISDPEISGPSGDVDSRITNTQALRLSGAASLQGQILLPQADTSGMRNLFESQVQFYMNTSGVESEDFVLEPFNLYGSFEDGTVLLRSLEGRQPYDIELSYRLDDGTSSMNFSSSQWTPSNLIRLKNSSRDLERVMNSVVSAGIKVNFSPGFIPSGSEGWVEAVGWLPVFEQLSTLSLSYDFENESIRIQKLELGTRAGDRLAAVGSVLPGLDLMDSELYLYGSVSHRSLPGVPEFATGYRLEYDDHVGNLLLNDTSFYDLDMGETDLTVSFTENRIGLQARNLLEPKNSSRGSGFSLEAEYRYTGSFLDAGSLRAELGIESFLLRDAMLAVSRILNAETEIPQLPADLAAAVFDGRLEGEILFEESGPSFFLFSPDLQLSTAAYPDPLLKVSGNYKDGRIRLPALALNYQGLDADFSLEADMRSARRVTLSARGGVNEYPYSFNASYITALQELSIKGEYDSSLIVRTDDAGIKAELTLGRLPIPSLPGQAVFSVNAGAEIQGGDLTGADINLRQLKLTGLQLFPINGSSSIEVSGSGSISDGFILDDLEYLDSLSRILGEGTLRIEPELSGATLLLNAGNSIERYELSAQLGENLIDIRSNLVNFPVRRIGFEDLTGLIDGTIAVSGRPDKPVIDFGLRTVNTRLNNDEISAAAEGRFDGQIFSLSSGVIDVSSFRFDDISGVWNSAETSLDVAADLYLEDATGVKNLTQQVSVSALLPQVSRVLEADSNVQLSDLWDDASGRLTLVPADSQADAPEWNFSLFEQGNSLQIMGGSNTVPNSVVLGLDPDGSFRGSFAAPLPVSFAIDGFFEGSRVDVNFTNLALRLEDLGSGIDLDILRLRQGELSGGVRITGSFVDPDFFGTLVVRNLEADLDMVPEPLTVDTGFIILEGKTLYFTNTEVRAGEGRTALEGSIDFDRWIPSEMLLYLTAQDPGIPIAYDFSSVVVDGWATGSLQMGLRFSDRKFSLSGDLVASATGITLSEGIEAGSSDTDIIPLDIALNITAGRGVEFFWPTRNFPILRSSILNGQRIELVVSSPPERLSLIGDLSLRGGEIFYFEQNFYIRQGRIRFNENEELFDPLLSLNAEARGSDRSGPVRIYLEIVEDTFSQLQPRFSSDPSRSEPEIIALLGGRVVGTEEGEEFDLADALISSSEILGQVGILGDIEDEIRERMNLDLFSLRTGLFQNLLEDVIVTPDPDFPLNSSPVSLGRYLQNTTLLMGRYLGDDVFLEGMAQLQEQSILNRAPNDLIGIELDLEVSLELLTPFFTLTWSFAPENPEALFVTDHTLTFTRDFSPGANQ